MRSLTSRPNLKSNLHSNYLEVAMKINNSFKILVFILFSFFYYLPVEAKQDCCSNHKGVCACKCCVGNLLSEECLHSYPKCNRKDKVKKGIKGARTALLLRRLILFF